MKNPLITNFGNHFKTDSKLKNISERSHVIEPEFQPGKVHGQQPMTSIANKASAILFFGLALIFLQYLPLSAQGCKHTLSGYVRDGGSSESLIGVVVHRTGSSDYVTTNAYGFYSIDLPEGESTVEYTFVGFVREEVKLNMKGALTHDVNLATDAEVLQGSTIQAYSKKERLKLPQTGVISLSSDVIAKVPVLFGEKDIIKIIQMTPGVQAPSEGSSGFCVRGGGTDQNLILIDEAPVFNAGHFLGFFSIFNDDIVKSADLYKGDIAPRYGGKVSSLLDVHTKDGNMNSFSGAASIGLISSKLFLESPIVKQKASFMVAARTSYAGLFLPLFPETDGTDINFYDINAKVNWRISDKDRLYLSAFSSNDNFGMNIDYSEIKFGVGFRNNTQTLMWNHILSPKLFFNLTLFNSIYNSDTAADQRASKIDYTSRINSPGTKLDFTWYLNPSRTIRFGADLSIYALKPDDSFKVKEADTEKSGRKATKSGEGSLYVQMHKSYGEKLSLRYGVRLSAFHGLNSLDSDCGYINFEPRFSASVKLGNNSSLKGSYSRNSQYLQQAVYSISGSPLDIWFTSSNKVKPQLCDQFSAGYYHNFLDNSIETSVELFYRDGKNTFDFVDHPDVFTNPDLESQLRFGKSYAYGTELMAKFDIGGHWSGWVSYAWNESKYVIPELNGGLPYDSPKNHKHCVNIVASYSFNDRINLAASWVYNSGAPTTYPASVYFVGDTMIPYYTGRNKDRMPDYHRLDLSLNIEGKKIPKGERWHGKWNFSVYNAYGRHNAWAVYYSSIEVPGHLTSKQTWLFFIVPSVTYTINL